MVRSRSEYPICRAVSVESSWLYRANCAVRSDARTSRSVARRRSTVVAATDAAADGVVVPAPDAVAAADRSPVSSAVSIV